ncbi:hypothetical protein SEUCBS140593_004119 [Sporothrix eucalyptigena]|uniref:Set domain containing protein n=1 Tax=Sporothrix eucalyptigena TaxID=1812306 RepID=A0ABP0BLR5_9PEZI
MAPPRRRESQVIDLTDEAEDELEIELEIISSTPAQKPRSHQPLSREQHQPQQQQQQQYFATIYREGDAVPSERAAPSYASTTSQPSRSSHTSPLSMSFGLGLFYSRQVSSFSSSANRTASSTQNAAAASNTSSPARTNSQRSTEEPQVRTEARPGPLYNRASSSSLQRPPSAQSASPRPYGEAVQPPPSSTTSSSSSRPSAPGSLDYIRAQSSHTPVARSGSGSTPNTPNMTTASRSQASPTQTAHSWLGQSRSPPLANSTSQQSQTAQGQNGYHRTSPLLQSFPPRSAYGHNPSPYHRQASSPQSLLHQRQQEEQRQLEAQRQERQRLVDQQRRQEQQRQAEQQEQRRQQEQQRKLEQQEQQKLQEQQRLQEDKQRQQRQEELQRLQRQQQQQQHQHLAQAHAQAQAHQAQTQQQHGALHHSASTGHLFGFTSGCNSPPRQPQHSAHLHSSTNTTVRWSGPLATSGSPSPSLRTSQSHPLPTPAGFRSSSAGAPPAWQSSLSHLHTPHRRNSPLRNSPPSPTLPPVQTRSPPHPFLNPQFRQQSSAGRSPSLPSTASPRPLSLTPQPQHQSASQRPQQPSTQQPASSSFVSSSFSLRKSPPRDSPGQHTRPSSAQQTSSPKQASNATAQTAHGHSPSRPREPLWPGAFGSASRAGPAKESPLPQQRPAASSSTAHLEAVAAAATRASWAGPSRDTGLTGYLSPSPPWATSSLSPVSNSSGFSSPRPGSAAASGSANNMMSTAVANPHNPNPNPNPNPTNNPQARFSAQIDLLPDRLRLRTGPPPSQPISLTASSTNSPVPPSPSTSSSSSFPEPRSRTQDNVATRQDSSPLSRSAHKDTRQKESLPDAPAAPTIQEVTRQDAALQNETLQAEARRAESLAFNSSKRRQETQSADTLQIEVFQAEARRVDALQAEVLLSEARRAEAMQAAEALRADAMQIDAIQAEVIRTEASPATSASTKTTPVKSLARTPPKTTPKAQQDWTVAKIVSSLEVFLESLLVDHGRDVEYAIDMIKPRTRTVYSSFDDFADLPVQNIEPTDETSDRVLLRGKLHRDNQRRPETRTIHAKVLPLKSPGEAVPKYRFHHVEIAKNILSPNTPLKFIPHLRDFEDNSDEKRRHDQWIEELESMERKSGFDSSKLFQKGDTTRRTEFTKLLSDYLDHWIARLGIDNCSKTSLIRYMANESQNDQSITPQQKNSLLSSCGEDSATPRAGVVASMLTEAFNRVFESREVTLYDVLKQDEAVENVFDPKKATKTKDQDKEPSLEQIQQYLGTYTSLKCMICNTHSCEHGEFDAENVRRCFSIDDLGGKLWKHVERRRDRQLRDLSQQHGHNHKPLANSSGNSMHGVGDHVNGTGGKFGNAAAAIANSLRPCRNQCYRSYDIGDAAFVHREWTENETSLLRSFHMTFANSTSKVPCALCPMMGRHCWEIYRRMKELGLPISLRPASPLPAADPPPPIVKPVTWYDRHRKVLNGDWSDHTYTHFHALREQREPCNHDGPCTAARGCPCVEAKLLCERFCRCTAESCAFKFTGCACHGSGKTCYMRQKEGKPCICVQLNRECDPVLCGGCGARERADPENRDNDELHATGCQNVSLQRGKSKAVVLGQSQLQGCGYGLFTAEDIGADEFIIEYIGELITHDEGVRREARRGDFFDQGANASYLFTLLEQDGIWVDAAIYGNLSRYINHASESDKRGCNITPKILYVNGEFRIRFTAMRDIKAGEELFFNYGENFPNLTKKLLEDKASASDDEADATTNTAKNANNSRSNGNNSRRSAAQRSNSSRRKNQNIRSRAPTKTVQSGPSNRSGGGNSRNANNRRARPRGGARKEAPPAHVEDLSAADDDSDDNDADDMDVDGGSVPQPRRPAKSSTLKRKRHNLDYDDGDGDDESDDEHNERSTAASRKRDLSDDEVHEPSHRGGRSSRRRPGAAATSSTVEAPTLNIDFPETPRRPRARLHAKQANNDQGGEPHANTVDNVAQAKQEDHDDDDDIPLALKGSGAGNTPQNRKRRAVTRLSSSVNGTVTDGDIDTDEQPLRKRPRIATRRSDAAAAAASNNHAHTDSDNMVVDSDESMLVRPLRQRRTRQRNRVTELLVSELSGSGSGDEGDSRADKTGSPVVMLGTTDDDQGSVFSGGHSRRQNQNSTTAKDKEHSTTPASISRRRYTIVPDSDDEVDTSTSQTGRSRRATASRPSSSSQTTAPAPPSRVATPHSRPHTPKAGNSSNNAHSASGGDRSSRRSLRSDETQPSQTLQNSQQRTHSTPVTSRPRSAGGEDDSGASSVDRSQRKRQMPARYRTDE